MKFIDKYSVEFFVLWRIFAFLATLACWWLTIELVHNSNIIKVWGGIISALSLAWANYKVFMWFKKLHGQDPEFDHPSWIRGCFLSSISVFIAIGDFFLAYVF